MQVVVNASGPNGGEEEDLVDIYMRTVPWTKQTTLSAHQAIKSVWKRLVIVRGVEHTKESLKNFWTTLGVVSALLLSVTYSTVTSPLSSDDPNKSAAVSFVRAVGGISLVLSLVIIVTTVIYLIEIDNCTTHRDLEDFIRSNGSLFDILTGFFSASVGLLLAQALATMYVTFSSLEFWIIIGFAGFFAIVTAVFAAVIAGHNRFRMWARYDSPLAIERRVVERLVEERQRRTKAAEEAFKAE
ncbi:hypothetical protein HXX76_008155 [Chlamydomonas incerta]|uniref:PGG domain-containing protein n=1 Tax=Chlamydomonas incerta TaxID=51695 RepID=A0A835VZM7_CHLIN|nr:hypothetical protein HXX76_008153 [Chlamydomonas incerta]KAG2433797.1 hypothetical protein HXX76_008155 [Chlamydomonas incerta]|eukprot:KAG2433795.1 hypothetical protein HXX76_008153 [Chlamydomonas incerta]